MAMKEAASTKSLVLSMYEGVDKDGKSIKKKYTYPNVKFTATADSLQSAAEAFGGLCKGSLDYASVSTIHDLIPTI